MSSSDPYFVVKHEIEQSLRSTERDLYERDEAALIEGRRGDGTTLEDVTEAAASTASQIDELGRAVEVSGRNPARFGLTREQVDARRVEVRELKLLADKYAKRAADLGQARALTQRTRTPPSSAPPSRAAADGGGWGGGPRGADDADDAHAHQQLLMARQDEDLTDLQHAAQRVGAMGLTLGSELELQAKIVDELEEDLDHTQSRLGAARAMINKLGQRMGKWQWVLMAVLILLLIILVSIAFN